MTCKDCFHKNVCKWCDLSANTKCVYFSAKRSVIELPCCLGDKVYHVSKYNTICEAYVDGIRYGQKRGRYGLNERYVTLRSTINGYIEKVAFSTYVRDVFSTHEEAEREIKRREESNNE